MMRCEVPNRGCGWRNQSESTPSSETRFKHAVRAHDGRVHGAGKNQRSHHHHEHVEDQARQKRAGEVHGQAADQILEILRPHFVGDDHHREEGNQRREDHAVNENDQRGLLQVRQLGMLDFAVHLRERFFSAHGQHGVAQPDEHGRERDQLGNVDAVEPAQGILGHQDVARDRRRRQMRAAHHQRVSAPSDQHHHHHGGELHDPQSFFARFGDALDVLPPEIDRHHHGKCGRRGVRIQLHARMRVGQHFVQQAAQVLARGNAADRAGQHVVEHQRGNGKFRQRAAHRFLHHAIHAAAHEHAAALDVNLRHGVGKQHGRENEPRSRLADELLRLATRVIGRGSQVVQNDRRRAPIGNERQHGRGGHKDFCCWPD